MRFLGRKADLELDELGKLIITVVVLIVILVIIGFLLKEKLYSEGEKAGNIIMGFFD